MKKPILLVLAISAVLSCKKASIIETIPVTVEASVQVSVRINDNFKLTIHPMETHGFDVNRGDVMQFRSSDISNGGIAPNGWVSITTPSGTRKHDISDSNSPKITITK